MEKQAPNQKKKLIYHSLIATDSNKFNNMEEEAPNQKTKKKPSQPMPEGLKPKTIEWKKKAQIKKQKKSIIA